MKDTRYRTQVLVIGSGLAGATCALTLADAGVETTLIASGPNLLSGNTPLAQGGIVFTGPEDSPKLLERDILEAGWKHNNLRAVRYLCKQGPTAVKELLVDRLGIPFNKTQDCEWDLRLEGGHRAHRIVHCADYTGRAIIEGLLDAVSNHENIRLLPGRTAVDLITSHHHSRLMEHKYQLVNQCLGAYVLIEESGVVETVLADATVLATGGLGQVYLHTTNTAASVGSALAMGYRAGAKIRNAEFVQFHPTALYHRSERRFLISEALRGEGARLVNGNGKPFMHRYDPRADLAPRDIVSRAILEEMLRTGADSVFLDAANYLNDNAPDLTEAYPTIFNKCKEMGIDIRREPIPVVPAAHYFCGGLLADERGRTTLERCYAVGECACTGVHGANRLASTSLLEALLWGRSAGQDIAARAAKKTFHLAEQMGDAIPDWQPPGRGEEEDPALVAQDWATLKHTMWNYAGITRSKARLARAFEDLRNLGTNLRDFYKKTPLSKTLVDLFHGSQAAYGITIAALKNKTSIGCHYRQD